MTASRGLGKFKKAQKSREGVSELGEMSNLKTEQGLKLYSPRAQPKVGPPRGRSRQADMGRAGWQGGDKTS